MRTVLACLSATVLLAGCAQQTTTAASASTGRDGSFDCVRTGEEGGGSEGHRIVMIRQSGNQLIVDVGGGREQVLDAVQGTSGQLFANQLFAWRVGNMTGTLTDVEKIATYACQRVGDLPSAGGGAQ